MFTYVSSRERHRYSEDVSRCGIQCNVMVFSDKGGGRGAGVLGSGNGMEWEGSGVCVLGSARCPCDRQVGGVSDWAK